MSQEILGTRARGKKNSEATSAAAPAQNSFSPSTTQQIDAKIPESNPSQKAATECSENNFNSARREYFASIIPSIGQGLVKILRTSNNLKRDIEEELKK